MVGALVPALLVFFFLFGLQALRVTGLSLASVLLGEWSGAKLLGNKLRLYDGSAVITAFLFALMLPVSLSSGAVALGGFFGIFFGKEIFGGLGQNPFNPALVGRAFVELSFPVAAQGVSLGSASGMSSHLFALALFMGGAILIGRRVIRWEQPVIYGFSVLIFSWILTRGAKTPLLNAGILLTAFFIITDPVTSPLTRWGQRGFALGAGILAVSFQLFTPGLWGGVGSGILLMNALVPRLDEWFRPQQVRL